jgi:hypothetical protein
MPNSIHARAAVSDAGRCGRGAQHLIVPGLRAGQVRAAACDQAGRARAVAGGADRARRVHHPDVRPDSRAHLQPPLRQGRLRRLTGRGRTPLGVQELVHKAGCKCEQRPGAVLNCRRSVRILSALSDHRAMALSFVTDRGADVPRRPRGTGSPGLCGTRACAVALHARALRDQDDRSRPCRRFRQVGLRYEA